MAIKKAISTSAPSKGKPVGKASKKVSPASRPLAYSAQNVYLAMAMAELQHSENHLSTSMAFGESEAFIQAVKALRGEAESGIAAMLSRKYGDKEADDSFGLRHFAALIFRAGELARMIGEPER